MDLVGDGGGLCFDFGGFFGRGRGWEREMGCGFLMFSGLCVDW